MTEAVIENPPNEPPATPPVESNTPPVEDKTKGTLGGDTPPPVEPGSMDWASVRDFFAGDDEKFAKQLSRYKTAEDAAEGWRNAIKGAQQKQQPLSLPENATDEQVSEFRTALGLPEEAKDYPVSYSEGFEANDIDKGILTSMQETLHKNAGDPRTAQMMVQWYEDNQAQLQQDRNAEMVKVRDETQQTLRNEYGADYDGNIAAVSELMKSQLGEDGLNDILEMRFEDGTFLQDNMPFVKMMVSLATEYYGSTSVIGGDVETTMKSVDEKIEELRKMQVEDSEKYYSDDVQQQMAALYEQKNKLEQRRK